MDEQRIAITEEFDPELLEKLGEFVPSSTMRVETALSRYPIHNLNKTGSIAIRITRKQDVGEAEIHWSVSPSRDYGEPRQLAYKLDTLVINRRIDECGRPIPRLLRLGSLREVCRDLGAAAGGDLVDSIKTALHQNAGAYITAKISYTSADGKVRRFESGFTRYSVIFTGEQLPDEKGQADAVYIYLNEQYWRLLNQALFRPLDYEYQKTLPPGPQRFYELVSYYVYGAIHRRRGEAKLLYSDYCLRAPQTRYLERSQMQKQMYKIHRPHIDSQYITAVRYRKITDLDGNPDWEIYYTPGPRARAQYSYFTGKQRERRVTGEERVYEISPDEASIVMDDSEQGRGAILEELVRRGISRTKAVSVLKKLSPEQPILDQLEWGDHLIARSTQGTFRNPPGFYLYLLTENVLPPANSGFESSRQRRLREAEAHARQEQELEHQRLEFEYEEYKRAEVERHIASLPANDLVLLREKKRDEFRKLFKHLPSKTLEEMLDQGMRADFMKSLPFRSFPEYAAERRAASQQMVLGA